MSTDEGVQADLPEPEETSEHQLKIRPLERVKLYRQCPPEEHLVGQRSHSWILQDGRPNNKIGSDYRDSFITPKKIPSNEGIRKQMLTKFFWGQMLEEVLDELKAKKPVSEYCTEYDANYVKGDFQPRDLSATTNREDHIKYPLYGTGSSPTTFYSETIKKIGQFELLEPFRRTQDFTKPMGERLDNGWVL